MSRASLGAIASFVASALLVACGGGGGTNPPAGNDAGVSIDDFMRRLPTSCAFDCKNGCPDEAVGPFVCPAMDDWSKIPHDDACGASAPPTPTPVKGQCTATEPTGEAIAKAGAHGAGWILPDGHRLAPAGMEAILSDATHVGGFPVSVAPIPSTHYAIVVEAGFGDHLVRTIDLDALANGKTPVVVSTVPISFANWGLAVRPGETAGTHRAYVSGGDSGKIFALDVADATGVATLIDAKAIDLGTGPTADGKTGPYFAAGIAVTADGKKLVATSVLAQDVRVMSLDASSWGKELARVELGHAEHYTVAMDPNDATGEVAYVTLWGNASVVSIDLATGTAKQTIAVGKDPEQMAFLDARWMVVAAADGDVLTLVDRVAGAAVASVPISQDSSGKTTHGWAPTAMVFDAAGKRLYVAESIVDAVEVFDVDLSGATPTLTSRGRLPTGWWPTDLALDGSTPPRLLVLDGRGHGTGSGTGAHFSPGDGEIAQVMHGSIELVDFAKVDLAAATKTADANADLKNVGGYPTVQCPPGVDDFPIPTTNDHRSRQIQHVVLVVRENKNFDGVLGDMPNVDGKADDVLDPGHMDEIWTNFRAIGRTWSMADNYYTDAEYSSQGHVWTTYGRTTDFTEKSWLNAAAGKGRILSGGVTEVGRAEEGSIFEWLLQQNVEFDVLGEATGAPKPPAGKRNPVDGNFPGLFQQITLEDVNKSCYVAARARVLCDFHDFVYVTLSNDHTVGGGAGRPTPETMIAVNDEATGVLLDAISHSPMWPSTLVIVTEDDPQDGADHVDLHRTPIVFASPWVKRGYVARGHYDVASIMKLLMHVRGIPYPSEVVARAPLPLEMFTSTPDYSPFTFSPRKWPRSCNSGKTSFAVEASQWTDWDDVDEQIGLGVHVRKMMKASPEERGPMLPKNLP